MKKFTQKFRALLLCLSALLAVLSSRPIQADDLSGLWYSSSLNALQVLTKAAGYQLVPVQTSGSFLVAMTGPCALNFTARYVQMGNVVTVYFPSATCTSSSGTTFTQSAVVPSAIRPSSTLAEVSFPFTAISGSTVNTAPGQILVFSSGNLLLGSNYAAAGFSSTGVAGLQQAASFTYNLQ